MIRPKRSEFQADWTYTSALEEYTAWLEKCKAYCDRVHECIVDGVGPVRAAAQKPLSPGQQRVLEFLQLYQDKYRRSPTGIEIRDAFEWASKNAADQFIKELEEKEYIRVDLNSRKHGRMITILRRV